MASKKRSAGILLFRRGASELEVLLVHPGGPFWAKKDLGAVKQKAGKVVQAWALEGDLDAAAVTSNTFSMQWPPRSGRTMRFPEIDRIGWFAPEEALRKLLPGQRPFVEEALALLETGQPETSRDNPL